MRKDTRHTHALGDTPGAHHELIRRLAASDRLGKYLPPHRRHTARRIADTLLTGAAFALICIAAICCFVALLIGAAFAFGFAEQLCQLLP